MRLIRLLWIFIHNPIKHYIIFFVLLADIHIASGQSNELEKIFNQYLVSVRMGEHPTLPRELINSRHHRRVLMLANQAITDTLPTIRISLYYLIKQVGLRSTQTEIRKRAVELLVEGCKDNYTSNVGSCIDYLTEFNRSDFTVKTQDSLLSLLVRSTVYPGILAKLCGYVIGDKALPTLGKLLMASYPRSELWAIRLAMVRAGDEQQAAILLEKLKNIELNDGLVYSLIPDLVYTRNKQIFNRMVEWLNDDRKLCTSSNPDKEVELVCGYRIMEMLAPVIFDYPYVLDATGELLTNDYDKALSDIRLWFRSHPDYRINTERY